MCGLTVNVAVRVPEEAAVGVAAGLMQGQARVVGLHRVPCVTHCDRGCLIFTGLY